MAHRDARCVGEAGRAGRQRDRESLYESGRLARPLRFRNFANSVRTGRKCQGRELSFIAKRTAACRFLSGSMTYRLRRRISAGYESKDLRSLGSNFADLKAICCATASMNCESVYNT